VATQAAHALLAALLSHGPSQDKRAFRAGFLRWLSTTGKLIEEPLDLASLLSVCLRVTADGIEQQAAGVCQGEFSVPHSASDSPLLRSASGVSHLGNPGDSRVGEGDVGGDRSFNVCLQLLGKLVEHSDATVAVGVAEALRSTMRLRNLPDAMMATLLARAELG
jgi:hypothetical protein